MVLALTTVHEQMKRALNRVGVVTYTSAGPWKYQDQNLITHNLGTKDVFIRVFDDKSNEYLTPQYIIDRNSVSVYMESPCHLVNILAVYND